VRYAIWMTLPSILHVIVLGLPSGTWRSVSLDRIS